jgi:serine/threonine protein kinase
MQARISGALRYEALVGSSLGPYRLEQLLETNELGPVFLARGTDSRTYRLRLLPVSGEGMSPQHRSQYLDIAQVELTRLVALRHPHILSVVDYGQWRGAPYLVYQYLPLRPISALLAQNGPPDLQTVGRYLDQIASALEYAHEQGILHGQLTTDHLYLQMDGQIVVADFGVRRLIELGESAGTPNPLRFGGEAIAPEQALGRSIGARTDVYDLGAVLYRMLTAEPVFMGASVEEIAAQHVRAAPPHPSARRAGIPAELDGLIAATLAKDPNRRPGQPGAVANAYHQIVSPDGSTRIPSVGLASRVSRPSSHPVAQSTTATPPRSSTPDYSLYPGAQPTAPRPPRRPGRILLVTLLLLGIAATAGLALFVYLGGPPSQPTAKVVFSEANGGRTGQTNALQITAQHLPNPPTGSVYDAWLIDTVTEKVLPLGALTPDGQQYTVRFSGSVGNLLAAGDIIEITQEQSAGSVPVGKVIARGAWPDAVLTHLRHVLTSFPSTPAKLALITGALTQSKLLSDHAQALRAAVGHDQTTMLCETQVMINLLEGQQGPEYQALTPACAARVALGQGDGYGLLGASPSGQYGSDVKGGYIPGALEHTSLAATLPSTSAETKTHAQLVETALGNMQTWYIMLLRDLVGLQKTPGDTTKVAEIVTLSADAYTGVDANNNGQIEAIEGEGGAVTAYLEAQLMATLILAPVP